MPTFLKHTDTLYIFFFFVYKEFLQSSVKALLDEIIWYDVYRQSWNTLQNLSEPESRAGI